MFRARPQAEARFRRWAGVVRNYRVVLTAPRNCTPSTNRTEQNSLPSSHFPLSRDLSCGLADGKEKEGHMVFVAMDSTL